ncbi:MAG: NmrA family NAD(P)-binding protein [Anaerolineales bacterium]
MILITGAAGKTGQAIIRALSKRAETVRALVFRAEQVPIAEASGASEVLVGDMRDASTMADALAGIRAVYHIPPNMSADEVPIGQNIITLATSSGIEHFVYHSVFRPQIEAMPHHWRKMRVEETLFSSGLVFTILQPTAYAQNILGNLEQVQEDGRYRVPYSLDTSTSLVDLEDVAETAAIVLSGDDHAYATYELVGMDAVSQDEIARILGETLNLDVHAETQPLDAWARDARSAGLGENQIDGLVKMFQYYELYNFKGNARVLKGLLGREPTKLHEVIVREITRRHAG